MTSATDRRPAPRASRPRLPTGSPTMAVLALLSVTAAWGSTFPMLKDVVARVPVADFLAVRFLVAAAALTVVAPRALGRLTAAERRAGLLLGVVYGAAQVLQTVGLQRTPASVSGFVTGMYVVLTPVLGVVLLRRRAGWAVWAATALATTGLAVLSLHGLSVGSGEALTLAGALLYAVHIVGLGSWSRAESALGLTILQLWTISAVCGLGALPGGVRLPSQTSDWLILVYTALVAGALALVLQTWAQAHLSAERAAIVMTMEPVWAGAFAVAIGGEVLTIRVLLGGALVLVAMYLAELGPGRRAPAPVAVVTPDLSAARSAPQR